ncbi:hypothetical protein FRB90_003223 [Tulasnella sp. 427]|nr:hypothetical protein FRB90_003223 [Tulasnella sp. 427]
MKWSHVERLEGPLVAIADAEGAVRINRLNPTEHRLSEIQCVTVVQPDVLCLSLDWSGRRAAASAAEDSIVTSTSDGCISVLSPDDGEMQVTETWKAHDFEPWIAAWDYWSGGQVIYTGGDDCKMKGWDLRQGTSTATFVNKNFEGGVTTIQSHPYEEHVLAVGSYDSTVRLFDTRKPLRPLLQMDVGGGAWRVKWHPSEKRRNDLE